jgi:type II secretory ATPase GspE/PulE/Tfp pilus assembly ATPase PilB-like protein
MEEPQEKTLGIAEVMERLGLSRAEVYRRVKDGELAAEKTDQALRFAESAVAAFEAKRAEAQAGLRKEIDQWLGAFAERLEKAGQTELPGLEGKSEEELVTELVQRILSSAALEGVSDIHLDPVQSGDRLLFRFEGNLKEVGRPAGPLSAVLKAKLKALVPAPPEGTGPSVEGRAIHAVQDRTFEMQLRSVPTALGEHIHVHLFDVDAPEGLEVLGYTSEQAPAVAKALTGRPGLFVVAGAADALAERHHLALAAELAASGRLVVSLEHRLQARSELLVQLEARGGEGGEFDQVFRRALDMSPDVLILDEVRDAAQVQALLEAVWAGALVVAGVRAPGAAAALVYLIGLAPCREAFSQALVGVVERMAMRRLCPDCRVPCEIDPDEAEWLGVEPSARAYSNGQCDTCGDGFLGRRGVYGIWLVDDELAGLVRAPELPAEAIDRWDCQNRLSLRVAIREAVLAGDVTLADARRLLSPPEP